MGTRNLAVRIAGIALAGALLVALVATLAPQTVEAPTELDPAVRAKLDVPLALEEFGTPGPGNYCPIFFGGPSVRPDRAILLLIFHAETQIRRCPRVADVLREQGVGRLYAWVESASGTMFITNFYRELPYREQLAVIFHEVRGHWELRLTDVQMQAVLCQNAVRDDTHCITYAILQGCPTLKGATTEHAYKIALAAGPLITDAEQ